MSGTAKDHLMGYRFSIQLSGYAPDDPHYSSWSRKFDGDAQAELFAKRISEENRGARVTIRRAGAAWVVWCGFVPENPFRPGVRERGPSVANLGDDAEETR